jgi:lipopolysaccharide transport system permease protein
MPHLILKRIGLLWDARGEQRLSDTEAAIETVQALHIDGDVVNRKPEGVELRETEYTSAPPRGLTAWKGMAAELWLSRELIWRLFMRDFTARYRQSLLGYIWAVLPVLLTAVTFTWLNRAQVLAVGATALPYPLFVLLNMTVWQLFAGGLTGATNSLVNAGSLIAKINFPREALVLAAFGQALVDFLLRSAVVAGGFLIYRVTPAGSVALVPLALLPLCLFTLGLGFLCALLNGVMRDIGQLITFSLTFWMLLTPVVYPPVIHGPRATLALLNPLSPFVVATQDLTVRGHLTQPAAYVAACALSAIVFVAGWRVFHATEPRIAERA